MALRSPDRDLRPADPHVRPAARRTGAAVAFVIASLAAAIAVPFGAGPLLLPGVPVAAVMGYVLAPSLRPQGSDLGAAVKMSISTVLLVDAVVVLGLIAGNQPDMGSVGTSPVTLLGEAISLWSIGLLIYGLPALAFVTGPCAVAWVVLVTRLSRRSADNEAR